MSSSDQSALSVKQNGFAELNPAEALERCLVGEIGEFQTFAHGVHFGLEDQPHKLRGADRLDLFSHRLQGGRFAFHLPFSPAFELLLQVAQLAPRFVQTGGQTLELPIEQILIERDEDSARSAEDFLFGPENLHPF